MRSRVVVCLVVAALAGCGGGDDRPDLAAPPATDAVVPDATATTATETATTTGDSDAVASTPLHSRQRAALTEQTAAAADAIERWEESVTACVGPQGKRDDAGATCTHAAWDQLFDQMYAVQYELLRIMSRMERGPCRRALKPALDGVHGFLSGATPLEVVWLDDQQRPPALFDLESIVDVARPVPASLRRAVTATCGA